MENPLHNMYRTTNWDLIPNPFHPGVLLLLGNWDAGSWIQNVGVGCRRKDMGYRRWDAGCTDIGQQMWDEGSRVQDRDVGYGMQEYRTLDVGWR